MAVSSVRRWLAPAAVVGMVALVIAMLPPAFARDHEAPAGGHGHEAAASRALTAQEAAFHDQTRKLWEDHVTWTRLAIVTFAGDDEGFGPTADRLLANQEDIGDAIAPYYGQAAGDQLTSLLHDHITIAVELLQAAKSGDSTALADASGRWYANADNIADFLSAANPRYWPRAAMRESMKEHLDQTLLEAQDELTGRYIASVADYEEIHAHILAMADTLSNGIIRAFPHRFRH